MSTTAPEPVVSVLIANHNRADFLGRAIRSALQQTLRDLEIIIVDDASTDDSVRIARSYAARDDRIRVLELTKNAGPAGARNAGLDAAKGTWVAILDSDDFMHPERLQGLVNEAQASGAEICADDLVVFGTGLTPTGFLSERQRNLGWLTFAEFVASNAIFSNEPATGYLKPIFRRAFLQEYALRYDTALKIGEDFDLLARAFVRGAKFRLLDSLGYFYRKHAQSISHRLSQATLEQMLQADERLKSQVSVMSHELSHAFEKRRASIVSAKNFDACVAALKARDWAEAARIMWRHPRILPLFGMPIAARLPKWREASKPIETRADKEVCLISRQRLVGPVNGSSAYLLGICKSLHDNGYRLTLVSPNPGTCGRWPILYLSPEMSVFSDIAMRGAWRLGKRLYVAKDPRVFFNAAKGVVSKLAARAGIDLAKWNRPAPYVIGASWSRDEFLYVSRFAPAAADLVIADYAFSSPAIPFALSDNAQSMIVMHDLLSMRATRFREKGLVDSVATLSEADETRLLGQADAIIAIQDVEAKHVSSALPGHPVLLTPLGHETVAAPQLGQGHTVFFVGSNTAPNVIGLKWFLEASWPEILKAVPDCQLNVAGGVAAGFSQPYPNVNFLGAVPSLTGFYREAAVVISPLTVGSGLKIKIGEALSHGKAVVATSVSVEGISDDVLAHVAVCDEPQAFAQAVTTLLLDDGFRAKKARAAFDAYRELYSKESCYRELLQFVRNSRPAKQDEPTALEERTKSPRASGAVVDRAAIG
ncbi:MAG: glycosyltransferase [Proteobacteria bacterium]|nr:glycosyltransferase [Pseudomonadota bacterium]